MTYKVAILLTTFLRDDLLKSTVQSIVTRMPAWCCLYIGDQNPSKDKEYYFNRLSGGTDSIKYYPISYDAGLSYTRNQLVSSAYNSKIEYVVLTSDSIEFTDDTFKFYPLFSYLDIDPNAVVGFKLHGRIPWEYNICIDPVAKQFVLTPSRSYTEYNGFKLKQVDMVRNFFVARTDALCKVRWDNELKLSEHEDFFVRLKYTGYKVAYTEDISASYVNSKPPAYNKLRNRMYGEFRKKLLKKYNLNHWVRYSNAIPR